MLSILDPSTLEISKPSMLSSLDPIKKKFAQFRSIDLTKFGAFDVTQFRSIYATKFGTFDAAQFKSNCATKFRAHYISQYKSNQERGH
mmetsp:Transcript_26386/g.52570  ORF Transcript_26386/g.52570 Transcript_26386/m.52570 type:complete len:88 (+) Transcript_26386:249-512(+)